MVNFLKNGRALRSRKLKLVRIDLWGPSSIPSLEGSHYYLTFIDDYNRKVWVYLLKLKSNIFDIFNKLKPWLRQKET